jgi:putative PIN family toxin of toxin-antitoxin system
MRLVLDTDVIVAGIRSPSGASAALLSLLLAGRGTMLLSVALAFEYEATCSRLEHRLAANLSEAELGNLIDVVIGNAEPVLVHYLWRPQLRDAGDELVLEAAVNGRADAIVTFNRRDYGAAPSQFGIEVLSPGDALRRVRP